MCCGNIASLIPPFFEQRKAFSRQMSKACVAAPQLKHVIRKCQSVRTHLNDQPATQHWCRRARCCLVSSCGWATLISGMMRQWNQNVADHCSYLFVIVAVYLAGRTSCNVVRARVLCGVCFLNAKDLEARGQMRIGSLQKAKQVARSSKKCPLRLTQALFNACQHGAGVRLDIHAPTPSDLPLAPSSFCRKGAWIYALRCRAQAAAWLQL